MSNITESMMSVMTPVLNAFTDNEPVETDLFLAMTNVFDMCNDEDCPWDINEVLPFYQPLITHAMGTGMDLTDNFCKYITAISGLATDSCIANWEDAVKHATVKFCKNAPRDKAWSVVEPVFN